MSTQSFQLDSSLTGLSPALLRKKYDELTPEERRQLGFVRPATAQEFQAAQQPPGAPADFGGPVYPSSTPPVVSADTDPGIPVTPMPTGVSFQKQNAATGPTLKMGNPPAAELAQPGMQTIGAKFNPAAPYEKATGASTSTSAGTSAKFDPGASYEPDSSAQEQKEPPAKPGFWERAYETSGAKGLIEQANQRDQEIRDMYSRVGDHLQQGDFGGAISELAQHAEKSAKQSATDIPAVAVLKAQASQIPKAIAAAKAGDYSTAAGRGLAAITPLVGPAAADTGEKLGTDVGEGNFRGAAGDIAGFAGPLVAGKVVAAAPEIGAGLSDTAVAGVRAVGKGIQRAAASPLGQAVGDTASQIAEGADPDVVGLASPRAAHLLRLAGKTGRIIKANTPAATPAEVLNTPAQLPEGFTPRAPYQEPLGSAGNPFKTPAAPEAPAASPAASPTPETEDFEGVTSPQTENAAELGPEATPAETLSKKASPAELKSMLNDALGGKPLTKGVSLRNQGKVPAPSPAASLPDGFHPVDSTALKGFKYDPETREFESITQGGQHYIHGDVSPEEAMQFEAADSKGKAWQQIRNNPLIAKVLNGKRVAVTPGTMGAPGEVIPKSEAGMSPLDQKLANLQDFIRPVGKSAAAAETKTPIVETKPASTETPDLTTDWSKALADVQGKKPPRNAAAARANSTRVNATKINPDLESDISAAPEDVQAEADAETLANLRHKATTAGPDRLQWLQRLRDFETRDLKVKPRSAGETRQRFKGGT